MFCSNCGKSLKSDALICPNCGMTVGESRFDSSRGYTGAQTRLKPGQAVRVNSSYVNHYSRDDTVESSEKGSLPSDEDSMYRSVKGAGITGYGEDDDREPLFDSRKTDEPEPEEIEEPVISKTKNKHKQIKLADAEIVIKFIHDECNKLTIDAATKKVLKRFSSLDLNDRTFTRIVNKETFTRVSFLHSSPIRPPPHLAAI